MPNDTPAHGQHVGMKDLSSENVEANVMIHEASRESVEYVLSQTIGDDDGRSKWLWFRFPNGDLALGCFPYGDTYFAVEEDAQAPLEYKWPDENQ